MNESESMKVRVDKRCDHIHIVFSTKRNNHRGKEEKRIT